MARWAKYDSQSGKITEILTEAPTPPQQQTFGIVEIDDDAMKVGDSVEGILGIAKVVPGKGRNPQGGQDQSKGRQEQSQR